MKEEKQIEEQEEKNKEVKKKAKKAVEKEVDRKEKKRTEKKSRKAVGKKSKKEESQETEKQEINMVKEIIEMVLYLLFVLVVVWLIITYVGQRTVVDGTSMNVTLDDGDNLWVSKISYNIGEPERFDIVVFPVDDDDTYYIKRIIGMPGETVRIDVGGTIYINDKPLKESYGYEAIKKDMRGRAKKGVTLGEDEYFVMGDNRNGSEDSRFEIVGNVKRDILVGKAVFRIWPLKSFGKIE